MSLVRILTLGLLLQLSVHAALSVESTRDKTPHQQQQPLNPQRTTTEWPSLRFNLSLKRSSMRVHGMSRFSMIADPVVSTDGSRVAYIVFATFQQDTLVYNYTLVDGVAYYVTSSLTNAAARTTGECLDPELDDLPPINTIAAEMNRATAVVNIPSEAGGVECSSGNLFKVSVNDIEFALCASRASGFKLFGSDMDIEVEYLHTRMTIPGWGSYQG